MFQDRLGFRRYKFKKEKLQNLQHETFKNPTSPCNTRATSAIPIKYNRVAQHLEELDVLEYSFLESFYVLWKC